jgi:excisionase family DNA binding protein
MSTLDAELLARGQALAEDLRREGRGQDADVLQSLLVVAEQQVDSARFMTTGQVAARLGVSRQTVVNWIKRGVIPGVRLGGRLVVPLSVMERFAPIEQMLNELDDELPPLRPEEAVSLVATDREN